jgi:cytochrome c-type biogenesis protein CcmE
MDRQLGLPLPKPSRPRRQTKLYVGGAIIALVMVHLIAVSLRGSSSYYLTIAELQARGADIVDRSVRVSAVVDKETIDYDVKSLTLRFDLVDEGGRLPVVYSGVKPDMLSRSEGVVVEGRLLDSGAFRADTILVKCPSKYVEVADDTTQR